MKESPCARNPAETSMRVNGPRLVKAYYTEAPDPFVPEQRVAFGTLRHRGSAFKKSFTEWHILTITRAICLYRTQQTIDDPLFLGMDAQAVAGRWSYTERMPVASLLGAGLWPLLQMTLLPPLTFLFARRWAGRGATKGAL